MVITLIILALSAFFFVNGKIRSDVVALCALVLLILCGILTPEEALSGFSNSIVIMMVGLFVVRINHHAVCSKIDFRNSSRWY